MMSVKRPSSSSTGWFGYLYLTVLATASWPAALAQVAPSATEPNSTYYTVSPAPSPGSCPFNSSSATLTPEVEQGPYYVDELLLRQNITEDQIGIPFRARITVLDGDCIPVVGAFIDIWHCNATGVYSGYTTSGAGGNLAPASDSGSRKLMQMQSQPSDNYTWLRGTIETDSNGVAVVDTIVPGWYTTRVTHMHAKIHVPDSSSASDAEEWEDSHLTHTGNFFFAAELLDAVYATYPYSRHTGVRKTLLDDPVYSSQSNDDNTQIFTVTYNSPGDLASGLVGSVTVIVDQSANRTSSTLGGDSGSFGGGGTMPSGGFPGGPMPAGQSGQRPAIAGRRLAGFNAK